MKLNLDKLEEFTVHNDELFGEEVILVQSKIDTHWTQDNRIYRSSLWNKEGELISAGFPKFFNWGENIQLSPVPTSLKGTSILEKVDGSLLIVSKYKNNYILRTRGVVDARRHENGHEVELLQKKYPKIFESKEQTWNFSILFEWITPNNKIIINYGSDIDFILVGGVYHEDYSLFTQDKLDYIAKENNLKRPKVYLFFTLLEMIEAIKILKNAEGVVVYSNDGQTLHKLKGDWYLSLHHLKSELSSIVKVVDVWLSFNKPSYHEFYQQIHDKFDFEIAEYCKDNLFIICEISKKVDLILEEMKKKVLEIKLLPTRKEQAEKIIASYKALNLTRFAFELLNGKEINDLKFKQLMVQFIKPEKEVRI